MKNLKTIIAIIAISISSVVSVAASTEPATKEAKTILRTEIVSLLGNHQFDLEDTILEARVSVMLNNQNQLIVVSVNSKSETVSNFVKSKLNYKTIDVKGIEKGTIYIVPLKMTQEE
jgi:hypothetical protein